MSVRLLNRRPSRGLAGVLGLLPFLAILVLYLVFSDLRLAENPNDRLLPSFTTMGQSLYRLAFEEDRRSGDILLWTDTAASLSRMAYGVFIAALIGLVFGILNGVIPLVRAKLSPFVTTLSMIPPMAILPILFVSFGLGEVSKVVLIVIGIAPIIIRDLQLKVLELPAEQLIKAQTLDANTWQIIQRVVLPQVLPRLLDAVRLSLCSAWLFLIAAEAIASTDGLGYRIFLLRRYLAMDVILPYVLWITLLAVAFDWLLRLISRKAFPWYNPGAAA